MVLGSDLSKDTRRSVMPHGRRTQTASHHWLCSVGKSTRRCSGPPARACPRRTSRHLDIATSTYGSPKGDVAVGSPQNLRQRQLILTPLVPIQRPARHLVKDYNYGEIARAGIGFPQAYALRNRYALPAVSSFSSAAAHVLKTAKDDDQAACQILRFCATLVAQRRQTQPRQKSQVKMTHRQSLAALAAA